MKVAKGLIRLLKWVVIGLVIYYLYRQLAEIEWDTLHVSWSRFNLSYIGLAFLMFFGGLFYLALGWHIILWRMGGTLPYRRGIYIWVASQLGRFVPGKVVLLLGRVYMCQREGISKRITSASVVYEIAFMTLAGFILFLASAALVASPDLATPGGRLLSLVSHTWYLAIPGLVAVHPKVFYTAINLLLKRIGKEPLSPDLRMRDSIFLLAYYIVFWLTVGAGFLLVIKSVEDSVAWSRLVAVAGVYACSCTLGFFWIFLPDGAGLREATIKNLLPAAGVVTFAQYPFLIAIAVRAVSMTAELIGFVAIRAVSDTSKYKKPAEGVVAEVTEEAAP